MRSSVQSSLVEARPGVPAGPPRVRPSRVPRQLTVGDLDAGNERVPCLRLRGRWLSDLGFAPGARVTVEAFPGCIVLTDQEDGP